MCAAPRVRIHAPIEARAAYLTRAYADVVEDAGRLVRIVQGLRPVHPAERIRDWLEMAEAGDFEALARGLMQEHYDRRYEKHRARFGQPQDREIAATSLDPESVERIAAEIGGLIGPRSPA
jgi:tRNA 2-selenouridine synthase